MTSMRTRNEISRIYHRRMRALALALALALGTCKQREIFLSLFLLIAVLKMKRVKILEKGGATATRQQSRRSLPHQKDVDSMDGTYGSGRITSEDSMTCYRCSRRAGQSRAGQGRA
ncbi:hypothetical protein MPTK1_5g06570 [Marchantia polymorpha subsp. ruderalis]|uniref:Uncharacterized protein n=2 Tax=Marchantia polymorpha TaxID=3197 RepID=A0AAF6BFM1_MARPO|nr:hypothetical protein MARPO_0171s0026 [Marchantia polymorpha]BBN10805.1 hypothetical protein Mp_5g06570 [Marchantia polymorpha subsp. ruderalis]|eukprot:PTQ28187.1 hypothetical protein MARPO_0171s0026 [Marchantia polymorpha]